MNRYTRLCSTSHNVSFQYQRASPLLFFRPRRPLHTSPRPRHFSTTYPLKASTPITDHHDLKSYLTQHHARLLAAPTPSARQKLLTSSVYLGTRYEYLIQRHLQSHLGFTLTRIGGKGDGGIDLIGSWTLPLPIPVPLTSHPQPSHPPTQNPTFRVLLQAKRLSPSTTSPPPSLIRELNGTILNVAQSKGISAAFATHSVRTATATTIDNPDATPIDLSHLPTLGILVTTRPLRSGIEKAMASSQRNLMYICMEEIEDPAVAHDQEGIVNGVPETLSAPSTKIRQIVWNAAASRTGLEGYNVVMKYSDSDNRDAPVDGEAVMMFQGRPTRAP